MNQFILFIAILVYLPSQAPKKYINGKLVDITKNPKELVLYVSLDKNQNRIATIVIPDDTIHAKKIISFISLGDSVSHEIGSETLFVSKYQSNKYNTVKFKIPGPAKWEVNKLKVK